MIEEYAIKKLIDVGFDGFKHLSTKDKKGKPYKVTSTNIAEKVNGHMKYVTNWSNSISFEDLRNAKEVSKVYVNLDYYLTPLRLESNNIGQGEMISLSEIFDKLSNHLVIVGQPGAGKTTTMKMICQKVIFDETYYPDRFHMPIVIRLRDISSDKNLYNQLFQALGYNNYDKEGNRVAYEEEYLRDQVVDSINSVAPIRILIILEGLDEIPSPEARAQTLKEFEYLCLNITDSTIVLTSRSSDYRKNTPNTDIFEIAPLNDEQIRNFTEKYLEGKSAEDLYTKITNSPYSDTAMRPLTLAHLCALYERYGDIPDKPKTLYRKIVSLLVEDWDTQRGINRPSKFSNFTKERILEYLYSFAFELTQNGSVSFGSNEIKEIYKKLHSRFELPENEYRYVLSEIESHNGLFIESSFKRYEFSHKSIQEYLTAEYLVHLGYIPTRIETIKRIPNELAIAVSISSNPNSYFAQLVCGPLYRSTVTVSEFLKIFASRLSLEKPDFVIDPILGFSLICMISKANTEEIVSFMDKKTFRSCSATVLNNIVLKNSMVLDNGEQSKKSLRIKQSFYTEYDLEFPEEIEIPDSLFIELEAMKLSRKLKNQ